MAIQKRKDVSFPHAKHHSHRKDWNRTWFYCRDTSPIDENPLPEAEVTEAVKKILNEPEAVCSKTGLSPFCASNKPPTGDDPFWKKKPQDKPAKTPRPKTKGTPHSLSGESTATQLPPLKTVPGAKARPRKKAKVDKPSDDNPATEPERTPEPLGPNADAILDDPVPPVQDTFVEPVETDPIIHAADPPSPAKTADKPSSPVKAANDNTDDIMIPGIGHTTPGNPVALSKHSAKEELSAMGKGK
nr:period circadian protein homolog 2-like [Aegilops tauschii subsp. strangulata]